jgi:diacylglycerol kinase (ATP)
MVILLVILIKAHFNRGTPMRGGMPSGHAAIAFSIATSTLLFSNSVMIGLLVLLLALLVSESRLLMKLHSPKEVLYGALLGSGVTLLAYLIFDRSIK